MNAVRTNVLILAFLSAAVVLVLSLLGGSGSTTIVAGIAGAALGWFATVARTLIVAPPEPTVEVPASHLERLAGIDPGFRAQATGLRVNVIVLALLSAAIVIMLAVFYWQESPEIVAAAAGTVIAWFAGAARDLVIAPPEPTVEVPSSTLAALANKGRGGQS